MNRIFLFALVALFLAGCAVTSDEYRYKKRFDAYFENLNEEEGAFFASNDLESLGDSLQNRVENDPALSAALREVKNYEAITSFNTAQTAYFFRYIILRELNRENYYKLMSYFDEEAQIAFVKREGIEGRVGDLINKDRKFKSFIESLKKDYRLYGFSNEQVIEFFREISLPEVTGKQLFHLLKLLKKVNLYEAFKNGEIDMVSEKFEAMIGVRAGLDILRNFDELKKLTGFTKMSVKNFFNIYYNVIMKEMDEVVVKKTIINLNKIIIY